MFFDVRIFFDFVFVDFFFAKKSFFAEVEIEASDRVKDATGNAALSKILAENEFFRSSIFRVSASASRVYRRRRRRRWRRKRVR